MSSARAVLVTGGGSGIGAAAARMFAAGGWRVAICGRRAGALRAVAAETGALDLVCDIADAGQVDELIGAVSGTFGRLDGLVLNAGVIAPGGVAELSPQDFSAMVAVNLTGSFLVARSALPHLLASGRGAVVSVRSEEHTSELQSRSDLVCRLLLEKKKKTRHKIMPLKKKNNQFI